MEMEDKKIDTAAEQALPVQELPTDIPAEVRQKLAEDLNEEAIEDLKQDMREAEKEEANDEEVKANPEMLTKSRLLKMLVKKQYVKLREVTHTADNSSHDLKFAEFPQLKPQGNNQHHKW